MFAFSGWNRRGWLWPHSCREKPATGQKLGSPGWAQSWPHLVSISHLTSVDGWWGQGGSGIPRAESGAVRARRRLAGLLMDTVRDLVLTLAAQLLVYPHQVLVTLVTPLEPSLLNVSVMDFRTRKALSVKFLVPPWPACDLHGSRIPSSGSSIQRPGRSRQIPVGAWTPSRPARLWTGGCPLSPRCVPLSATLGLWRRPWELAGLMCFFQWQHWGMRNQGDLAKVTYHIFHWENKLRATPPFRNHP